MFFLSGFIIGVYTLARFLLPLSLSWQLKLLLGGVMFIISQRHFLIRVFGGSLASPELSMPVFIITSWLYVAFVILFMLILLKDLLSLLLWTGQKIGMPLSLSLSGGQWVLFTAALLLSAYSVWQGIKNPEVRTVEVTIKALPKALDGTTIVQLTDVHASALLRAPRTQAIVEKTNAINPDIILFTGDLVDGQPAVRRADLAALQNLRAKYGIYGIAGNHEYYSDYLIWGKEYAKLGIHMLNNQNVILDIHGEKLAIAGLTDKAAEPYRLQMPDLSQTLAGISPNTPTILMDHRPGGAKNNAATSGVDLQLSGHTHGGHLPILNWVVALFNDGYVKGLYQVNDRMQLYVSAGTGLWNGFPARLGIPSEITRIVLRSGA
jgi:predicted MPP superfamily phosphohydrolase